MNWEAIGAIGEVLGALGVIVTLGYLAVQIRQNTRALMASTEHSVKNAWNELNVRFGTDSAAADLLLRGAANYSELGLQDRFRFTLMMRSIMNIHFDSWRQVQYGHMSMELWELTFSSFANDLARPGVRTWWEANRHGYLPSFQSEIDSVLKPDAQ